VAGTVIEQGLLGRSLRSLGISTGPRRRARGRARSRPAARRARLAVIVVAVVALLAGGWVWLRDSSLVAVQRVTISGLSGAQAGQIRTALTVAARGMTTLDVREGTLRAAVSSFPVVKGLKVSTQFPHGLRIAVSEQLPVAEVMVGSHPLLVAADGTVLRDVQATSALPTLTVKAVPGGNTLQDPTALLALRALAAAPYPMLARISGISTDYWHGIAVTLRQGPSVYLGNGDQLGAKWQAALALLAVPANAGASYIDVTDPQRGAAGSGSSSNSSGSANSATSSSASPTTSTGASSGVPGSTGGV
jgi:cell division protein FtsQ